MTDKTVLITGCSSGIGLHCARALRRRGGWRVFAAARRPADVKSLQEEGFAALQIDLADSAGIQAAVSALFEETGGRLDALFNNGAYGQPAAVEDLPRRALEEQFAANVFGTQELTNAVLPAMRRQGSGRIIQNSSVLGFVALRYRGAYNASKYALEGLSDTMRLELAGSGVHVSLIEPGPITSEFRKNANKKFQEYFDDDAVSASVHADAYRKMLQNDRTPPFNLPPDAVYRAFLHALESSSPKIRYRVTVPTHLFWWCKRLLPAGVVDRLLIRAA